jgi:hypothetical protein
LEPRLKIRSDINFRARLRPGNVNNEAGDEPAQVEATVEAVGECGELVIGVLAIAQGVMRAGQGGHKVAEHRVDPGELGQVTWLAIANHGVSAPTPL